MLNSQIKQEIKEYSKKIIPQEACGLLMASGDCYKVFSCKNISNDKENEAILDPRDYMLISDMGNIVAHWHSQACDTPSFLDNFNAYNHNIYSIIYCWDKDKFCIIEPKLKDYLDRDFKLGQFDCYELVKNYYQRELNISMRHYDRDKNWYKINPNIIRENFANEGFFEVKEKKKHDVILFKKNHHMGVYLDNYLLLHHPLGRKSVIEYLDENNISMILRHKKYE